MEQIISDNKTKPVFLQEIKENISASTWKQITGKGESEHGFNLNDYGYVLKLLREQCKKDGNYISEELFMEQARNILYGQSKSNSNAKDQKVNESPLTKLSKLRSNKEI